MNLRATIKALREAVESMAEASAGKGKVIFAERCRYLDGTVTPWHWREGNEDRETVDPPCGGPRDRVLLFDIEEVSRAALPPVDEPVIAAANGLEQ